MFNPGSYLRSGVQYCDKSYSSAVASLVIRADTNRIAFTRSSRASTQRGQTLRIVWRKSAAATHRLLDSCHELNFFLL